MPSIAIIDKNECNFPDIETHARELLYTAHDENTRHQLKNKLNNYIWSIISPYVRFIEISSEDLIDNALYQYCKTIYWEES